MILPKEMGHGDMENAARFPHLHTPYYDHGLGSKKGVTLTFHLVQKIGQVTCQCRADYWCFASLLLSSETRDWPPGVALTVSPVTISLALSAFPYRRSLASSSGSSEEPLSDMPAKSPLARA